MGFACARAATTSASSVTASASPRRWLEGWPDPAQVERRKSQDEGARSLDQKLEQAENQGPIRQAATKGYLQGAVIAGVIGGPSKFTRRFLRRIWRKLGGRAEKLGKRRRKLEVDPVQQRVLDELGLSLDTPLFRNHRTNRLRPIDENTADVDLYEGSVAPMIDSFNQFPEHQYVSTRSGVGNIVDRKALGVPALNMTSEQSLLNGSYEKGSQIAITVEDVLKEGFRIVPDAYRYHPMFGQGARGAVLIIPGPNSGNTLRVGVSHTHE